MCGCASVYDGGAVFLVQIQKLFPTIVQMSILQIFQNWLKAKTDISQQIQVLRVEIMHKVQDLVNQLLNQYFQKIYQISFHYRAKSDKSSKICDMYKF